MASYLMDSFYCQAGDPTGFRKDTQRIDASGDDEAIEQAQRIATEQKPHHFLLVAMGHVADRIIYTSGES